MTQTMVVDGTPVTFEIWDTAGQEVEPAVHSMYASIESSCAVAVLDAAPHVLPRVPGHTDRV